MQIVRWRSFLGVWHVSKRLLRLECIRDRLTRIVWLTGDSFLHAELLRLVTVTMYWVTEHGVVKLSYDAVGCEGRRMRRAWLSVRLYY